MTIRIQNFNLNINTFKFILIYFTLFYVQETYFRKSFYFYQNFNNKFKKIILKLKKKFQSIY